MIILFYGNFALNIQKLCSLCSCKSLLSSALLLFWKKKLSYAIMWHVMAFKLSFLCQSPGSLHLSLSYRVTFPSNSEMRWLEPRSPTRKDPHSQLLHPYLTQAKVIQGLLPILLPLFFFFCTLFQFPLKFAFSDYSFHFSFTPVINPNTEC